VSCANESARPSMSSNADCGRPKALDVSRLWPPMTSPMSDLPPLIRARHRLLNRMGPVGQLIRDVKRNLLARDARAGPGLEAIATEVRALESRVAEFQAEQHRAREEMLAEQSKLADVMRAIQETILTVGQAAIDDEPGVRRRLELARAQPDYEAPFTDPEPLVSICIPTFRNYPQLLARSIPSALVQDYANIEVIVVGDDAPAETAAGIEELGDARVHYENLAIRGPYPDDPGLRRLVAGTVPLNRALQLARGSWIVINNDDDALRADHVSSLLAAARETRDEVVYGRMVYRRPDGSTLMIGEWPPVLGQFVWQIAIQHRALRLFDFNLTASLFDLPGDWERARRMLRAGVRFRMLDQTVCDYYPGREWGTNE